MKTHTCWNCGKSQPSTAYQTSISALKPHERIQKTYNDNRQFCQEESLKYIKSSNFRFGYDKDRIEKQRKTLTAGLTEIVKYGMSVPAKSALKIRYFKKKTIGKRGNRLVSDGKQLNEYLYQFARLLELKRTNNYQTSLVLTTTDKKILEFVTKYKDLLVTNFPDIEQTLSTMLLDDFNNRPDASPKKKPVKFSVSENGSFHCIINGGEVTTYGQEQDCSISYNLKNQEIQNNRELNPVLSFYLAQLHSEIEGFSVFSLKKSDEINNRFKEAIRTMSEEFTEILVLAGVSN